ncbi:hypothetical protein CAOG_07891 [Capsaspora owczarzaki ATCC 30864]|nr:hypothetical protein CAOG_07891 [Capsaspora owczarzaki ATCC 30864]|eukprot:XP_004342976.1 hypothetical protein CAOG_07891 [Capsaspora owczarzaki ATCC 30864]
MSQHILVYGGRGALGTAIISYFKLRGFVITSIDLFANDEANHNVLLQAQDSWEDQSNKISAALAEKLGESKVAAVLCVAGGWAGGNAASADLIKNADLMIKQSVWSSVIAARVASQFLAPNGLLALTGARAALNGTAGMIGYGIAKAAVHQLTRSLAQPGSGLPEGATAVAILPVTLDTPMNRKFMPDADFSSWTPLDEISSHFLDWTTGKQRPSNGALVEVVTAGGVTTFTEAAH